VYKTTAHTNTTTTTTASTLNNNDDNLDVQLILETWLLFETRLVLAVLCYFLLLVHYHRQHNNV